MRISIMRKAALYTFAPFMAFLTFKGGKGGAAPPPPPRDWTPENVAEGAIEFERRQGEADKWNDLVAGQNQEIGTFKQTYGDPFNTQASSANIASTDLADLIKQGQGYQDQVSDWSYEHTDRAPTWSAAYQASHGSTPVASPDTVAFQDAALKGIESKLARNINNLSTLKAERDFDLGQLNQAKSKYAGGMNIYDQNIDNYDINQLDLAKNILDQATNLHQGANEWNAARPTINTGLLDNAYQDSYNQIGLDYSDLQSRHGDEVTRINDFQSGLDDYYSQADMGISGMTIADLDQMNAYEQELGDKSRSASRFSSVLPYDLSNQQDDLRGLSSRIAGLKADRTNELGRIASAQSDYGRQAGALKDLSSLASIYDKGALDTLSSNMTGLRGNIGGFSSLLPSDFTSSTTALDAGRGTLTDVYADRKDALDAIVNERSALSGGLGDIDLWNEEGFNTQRSDLRNIYDDLSLFSGGRVRDIGKNIDTDRDAIDAKLTELAEYRTGLEEKAQGLQEQINTSSYLGLGDLTEDEGSLEAQRAEIELYNATQAMDELDAMTEYISGQRNRMQTDLDNTAATAQSEHQALIDLLGEDGALQFQELGLTDPMTVEAFIQMMRNKEEEEELIAQQNTGFSSLLN
jgi:hypothetical protein